MWHLGQGVGPYRYLCLPCTRTNCTLIFFFFFNCLKIKQKTTVFVCVCVSGMYVHTYMCNITNKKIINKIIKIKKKHLGRDWEVAISHVSQL